MANHKQAIKRHKQSLGRQVQNRYFKVTARTFLKQAREAIEAGDKDKAKEAVDKALTYADHIASKGVIHKNKASRLKSRLTRHLNAL